MKIVETDTVYSYIVSDREWYFATQDGRTDLVVQCEGAARDRGKQHASIFVEPHPILPVGPIPHKHQVWRWTAPVSAEERFHARLKDLLSTVEGVSNKRMAVILQSYAESYK
jgi:hypothetical protein